MNLYLTDNQIMNFEEMIGGDLDTGLQQLKTILDKP